MSDQYYYFNNDGPFVFSNTVKSTKENSYTSDYSYIDFNNVDWDLIKKYFSAPPIPEANDPNMDVEDVGE